MHPNLAKTIATATGVASLAFAACAAAQVTLYEGENFHGRSFVANGTVTNLDGTGFNDRASSAIVEHGRWELCEHMNFGGRCIVLHPGQYPSLSYAGLNNQISSIRPAHREDYGYAAPPPPQPQPYSYYPRHGEHLYQANVLAVRAVVGPPQQQCWVEQQQVTSGGGANVGGAVIGGILGGVLGHQIGSGRGNDVATAVGAVTGAAVGANVNRGSPQTYTQDVQRCANVPSTAQADYWDVTYEFRGQTHRAQLAFAPGPTITVNERGEPRA